MKMQDWIRTLRTERQSVRMARSDESIVEVLKRYRLAVAVIVLWLLFVVTRFVASHVGTMDGRGAGAEGGGSAAPRAAVGAAGANGPVAAPQVGLNGSAYRILYAPENDLEAADLQMFGEAHKNIDAALYSLTDKPLCRSLALAAKRGVRVRVYRDGGQYAQEQRDGRDAVCGADLAAAGVEIRVKPEDGELMHLKSYAVDGRLLRTGSANTSYSGERLQDNDAVFIARPEAAMGFERDFAEMWARADNVTVGNTNR